MQSGGTLDVQLQQTRASCRAPNQRPGANIPTRNPLPCVEVTSSDGQKCAVTFQVNAHRAEPTKSSLNDLARRMIVTREALDDVLDSWTHEEFVKHLEQFTLDPMCEHPDCDRLAEHVHHIQPIEEGGDRYSFSNLRSLCKPHHSELHRQRGRVE